MKKITYKDTLELALPDHWGVFDYNGDARIFENGDDKNIFEIYFISPKELKLKKYYNAVDMLNALPKGDEEIFSLGKGVFLRCYTDKFSRGKRRFISYYWFIANKSSLQTKKAVSLSYTATVKDMSSNDCQDIAKMFDKQIRKINFIGSEMSDESSITVTLESSGQTLIVGEVEGMYY
ncbi:hypothetical protein IMCC1989_2677 [gamma proteobacterium IMCC1989]|nr:hypothetical protein IMCC1989_2677 [gamma proteobacterium IMCC1989]